MKNLMNILKKNKKLIFLSSVFFLLFIYSYVSLFNKGQLTKVFNSDYLFTVAIYKSLEKRIANVDMCSDDLSATFFYEPIYNSNFFDKQFNNFFQVKILQSDDFPIIFSVYLKSEKINVDVVKQHIRETITPYLDHSRSCLGNLKLKIFPSK